MGTQFLNLIFHYQSTDRQNTPVPPRPLHILPKNGGSLTSHIVTYAGSETGLGLLKSTRQARHRH